MGSQDDVVTVTESTVMEGTHKDTKFIASMNVAAAQSNADNVDRLMENIEHQKEKNAQVEGYSGQDKRRRHRTKKKARGHPL